MTWHKFANLGTEYSTNQSFSDDKIQITILIMSRVPCLSTYHCYSQNRCHNILRKNKSLLISQVLPQPRGLFVSLSAFASLFFRWAQNENIKIICCWVCAFSLLISCLCKQERKISLRTLHFCFPITWALLSVRICSLIPRFQCCLWSIYICLRPNYLQ